jgi:ubiquinone/menaquinone biosynthesis C-methylase UbiE
MNGLVATRFLVRSGEKFAMVPDVAAYLVSGKQSYMGGLLTHLSRDLVSRWVQLAEVVRTGKPANTVNQQESGSEFFARFVEDIFNMSYPVARAAADAIFSKTKKPASVLDIAAGSGVWGIAMAQKSPHVSVTAVDWPDVVAVTKKVVGKHNLCNRFTFVEGDMHAADLGQGHRLATLGHILHSEGEVASRQLLRRVFEVLAPGGTILIAEFLPNDDRRGPATPLIFAVNMLVNTDQGDTFTFKEIKSWLAETGFRKIRQLNTPGPSPLILADKP